MYYLVLRNMIKSKLGLFSDEVFVYVNLLQYIY